MMTLALLTPFGAPFDTAVLFGALLVLVALALGQRADRDPGTGTSGHTDEEEVGR
jgi:hypothetical protein